MGHVHSSNKPTPETGCEKRKCQNDEFPQFGSVSVRLSWLQANTRRTPDQLNEIIVTGKGALFHGSMSAPPLLMDALAAFKCIPREIPILDSRAHHLLVTHTNGWHAISSPEVFSRHSGTCMIIGDKAYPGKPHPMKIGDCFRLGSVGLVVTEIKTHKGQEFRLDTKRLQYLREEALTFETENDEAILAVEENSINSDEPTMLESTSPACCYMCYETHDTPEDHLIAPCECRGDTRYLHVLCLQKWYQSSILGTHSVVIRTTGNGAPACKICGAAYKTMMRSGGVKINVLETECPGPYISMVVVTRHDTSPGLFNTKFKLNFGPATATTEPGVVHSEMSIGRSSSCHMMLDYRTVSTIHAKICYKGENFYIQDSRSSNGTMVYLQSPLYLPPNVPVRLRMGRSTLTLEARRNWSSALVAAVKRSNRVSSHSATLENLLHIMTTATAPKPSLPPLETPMKRTVVRGEADGALILGDSSAYLADNGSLSASVKYPQHQPSFTWSEHPPSSLFQHPPMRGEEKEQQGAVVECVSQAVVCDVLQRAVDKVAK